MVFIGPSEQKGKNTEKEKKKLEVGSEKLEYLPG